MAAQSPAATAASLAEAQTLVGGLIKQVQHLSLNEHPTMLDDLGLLPTLLWHFERYTGQTDIRVNFEHARLNRRFDSLVETAAYRIAQEALTNAARHAGVNEVTVRAWVSGEWLSMQIADDGAGFDANAALAAGTSTGLPGMRERATLLGGRWLLESAPGAGTRVTAEFPVGPPASQGDEAERPAT
jgi:signal transduction histidine kinase